VICGHIHHAAIRQVGDVLYINTGDWVESCTAVAETEEGAFEIIRWTAHRSDLKKVESLVEELEAAA
jgi:UDP-2,3-diacylglucosamine pyrophosphatase LpxH